MENTISKIAKVKSKKSKAGVFITLPDDIAKQFPLLGKHDDSDPHVTVLFIGLVPKRHEDLLAETVKNVAKEHEPFVMKLDDKVTYFPPTKHSDGCKIAKMKIISEGLHELHKALKKAITDAGIEIDDHFSSYKPHTTLAYMQPPRKTYDREVPSGSWLAEEIHIWNGDDKKKIRLGNNKKANDMISVRAGVKSDKPAYKEKIKTDKGYVWKYDEKHIEKRWKVKKDKIKKLEKDIRKVREQYKKDLNSDDDRTRAIAAIVGIMDDTAMRIGNEESAKDGTFGASTLKVKHVKNNKGKITFDFPGKGAIEQNVILKNKEVIKTINDLMKGKKANDFIFEVDGKKIWDRAVNRYLDQFGISAKDLRGFHSNRLMKEMLKKKDWKDALKEVSEIVGHEATTLKNQYIDPDIVEKYENKQKKDKKSERIMILKAYDDQIEQSDIGGPELSSTQLEQYMPQNLESGNQPNQPVNIYKNIGNIKSKVVDQKEQIKISPLIATAWNIIAPFMPSTVYLSSGFRSMRDQVNTIINYWNDKWGGYFAKNFPDRGKTVADMHKIINEYDPSIPGTPPGGPTREEATIAFPGKSLHQSGNALDISGVSANDITKIIEWINRHLGAYVSFNVLNEGDHVHVSIKKAIYPGPQNMMSVLREFYYGIKAPEITKTQKHQVYLSKRALNPQDETFVNRLEQKYFGANKPQISTKSKLTQLGIKSNVRLNETILAAWVLLKPHLPSNAVMTSGARTSQDQIRIINNYWAKSRLNEKYPSVTDPYQRSKLLIQNGWIVGPPTSKGKNVHLSGRAFDVSGANLEQIASAAKAVSSNPNIPVTFSQILIEQKNDNVHLGIGQVISLSEVTNKIASWPVALSKIGAEKNMKNQVQSIYEDLMKSNPPKEVVEEFMRAFGLDINRIASSKLSKRSKITSLASIKSDLIEKYPDIRDAIESASTKIEPKYLKWFTKEFAADPNDYSFTKIIDYINEFKKHQSILSNKDLYAYNLQSLVSEISQIKQYKDQALGLAEEYFNLLQQKRRQYSDLPRDEARTKAYEEARVWLNNIQPPQLQTLTRQAISSHIRRREVGDTGADSKDSKEMARSNSDIIYEDQNYLVVLPGTTQASKYFGSGTQWCTAAEQNNYFVEYSSKGTYLYYIIDKQNQHQDNQLRKIAWVMTKQNGKPELQEIFNALDNNIDRSDVQKYLGKNYDIIINAINRDMASRKDTKFEDILKNISKEQLEYELKYLTESDGVEVLNNIMLYSTNPESKEFANERLYSIAEKWAAEGNNLFFYYELQKTYPELGKPIAEKWAAEGEKDFFNFKLQKTYPELGKSIAEKWAAEGNNLFFYYELQETYPDIKFNHMASQYYQLSKRASNSYDWWLYTKNKLNAFRSEINKNAETKDDEDGKYQKEKSDLKWQQVLIDADRKWTRKEIRDHYMKNKSKILNEIKGKPVMLFIGTGKNQNVLKRNHNDKKIVISNDKDYEYWVDRRMLSVHRVLGPKTTLGFVDLDVHGDFSDSKVKEYARKIAAKIKSKYGSTPTIYDSGGTGYHVEFKVKEMSTDTLRNELRELCEDLNEDFDGFTAGIVKGNGVRTDTTTLKNNGNLRVPWALHEKYGGTKKPIGKIAKASKIENIKIVKLAEVYGWWLSPNGKLHPVEIYEHERFVWKHPEIFGNIKDPYKDLIENGGWIRVVNRYNVLVVDIPNRDFRYIKRIQNAFSDINSEKVSVWWPKAKRTINVSKQDFMLANSMRDLETMNKEAVQNYLFTHGSIPISIDEGKIIPWVRPYVGKQRAENAEDMIFVHTFPIDKINTFDKVNGELAVSSWNKSLYLFDGMIGGATLTDIMPIAFFKGKADYWFSRDVESRVDPDTGLRYVRHDEMDFDEPMGDYDEAWFNPSRPGNKLIAMSLWGDPNSEPQSGIYEKFYTIIKNAAEQRGIPFISLVNQPIGGIKQLVEPKKKDFGIADEKLIEKYKYLPEMKEYAKFFQPYKHTEYKMSKRSIDWNKIKHQMGFGVEDEPGDYFEKSRMFLHRQPLEYDKHNAHKLAENDPAKFFYLGLHKSNPSLEAKALENMIKDNPKFYFIFNFDKREEPEFKRLKQKASEELAQQDPRSFFYYNLHHEMPELGRGAILHLIDKDPRSFGQLGLEKDYPDYAESATHAINIHDPTKTEIIDSKASVKLSKRATNEKVDVLYVVHPDAIIEQSTNVDYVNSYLSKVKQAISSHVGPVIVTSLGRKFGSNTEAGDIAKLFMKEISGDSDINVIYETGAERSMLGLKAGEKMLDDLYLNNALGTIKVGGCFTGSWCKMCVDDTIKQLTKQYGPDHVVFDNSITAAAGIVPKGKLFEPSEAPQENKQASVKLSKRDDNVYSFTEATDELIEKIENLPGYRFGGPVGFFGQLTFNASVEVQWMLGTHKPAGSLEGYTVEVVIIHSDSDKEHIKDSFSTYEKAYNYLSDTLRDVVSYYQRLEEEKGAEIIPFPKMSSLISKRAEYGPDYGWKKWVQNYSNIPGQKNEKLSSRTLMLKKAFGPTVIAPMRLKKIKDPSELLDKYKKEELSIQHKFDGWKTQAIKDSKGAVKLYTRKGSGFEANVPELVKELEKKLDSGDFVLGELTFEKNGVQSISDVQTIAGSSPEKAQEHLKKTKGHLVFQAYDLLWNNGHDITKESYIERYNKLKKQIGESSIIKVPKNYSWDEFDIAMRNAQKEGSEGVVIKTKDSKYNYGPKGANEKTGDWYKYKIKGKKAQTDEVILNKYEHGKEKLKFPAYQYKDGKLFEVGVLSGLPKDKEKEIKNKIDNGKSVVVEVTYQEIMPSGKFRHMGWGGRERPDKPLKEVKVNK